MLFMMPVAYFSILSMSFNYWNAGMSAGYVFGYAAGIKDVNETRERIKRVGTLKKNVVVKGRIKSGV